MGQLVDELKPQFDSKINFLIIFVDDPKEQPVADEYDVQFVPMTMLFNKDGGTEESYSGAVNKDTLTSKLKELAE